MNYTDWVLKTAPQVYFPLDDVVASGAARQLGSATAVTGTYGATAKRVSRWSALGGYGRKGGLSATGGDETLLTSSANIAAANPWSAMIHFYQGTPLTTIDAVRWGTYVLHFFPNWIDDKTYLYTTDGAASYILRIGPVPDGVDGKWVTCVMVQKATGQLLYYMNGVLHRTGTTSTLTPPATNVLLLLGSSSRALHHFATWQRELTAAEIRGLHVRRGL